MLNTCSLGDKGYAQEVNHLLAQVEHTIYDHGLLLPGQTVLVAVSGGVDSMVLLHLFFALSAKHQWRVVVIHFNHQLRGEASDADETFVRQTAQALRLPFLAGRGNVRRVQQRKKISLEMAARWLRYRFFISAARKFKAHTVALAHHADDQIELFFLRLLRGSGGLGLAGMEWASQLPTHPKLQVVRPLLGLPKSTLQAYALQKKINFREDTSNTQLDIPRNRIRHELLPLLARNYQPALGKIIPRLMDIIGAEAGYVEAVARRWLEEKGRSAYTDLHVAVQRQVIQIQLVDAGIEPDFERIEQLRLSPRKPVMVAPDLVVLRDKAGMVSCHGISSVQDFNADRLRLPLIGARGKTALGGLQIHWRKKRLRLNANTAKRGLIFDPKPQILAKGHRQGAGQIEVFDADKIGNWITLRYWQPGDRFQPIGLSGPVKLQDFFINQKVPQILRRRLGLAEAANGGIFWVEGQRIAEGFKLDKRTKECLIWQWQRIESQ